MSAALEFVLHWLWWPYLADHRSAAEESKQRIWPDPADLDGARKSAVHKLDGPLSCVASVMIAVESGESGHT